MENIKDALLHGVKAARSLYHLNEVSDACGYQENPFYENFGEVADSIYALIGEKTETFEESITYLALTTPHLTAERRTEMLFSVYKKNFSDQQKQETKPDTVGNCMDTLLGIAQDFFNKCREAGLKISGNGSDKDDAG